MTARGYDPTKWGEPSPSPTNPPRPLRYMLLSVGDLKFVTEDGYIVTLVHRLNSVSDTGQKDENGMPMFLIDASITPTIERALDQNIPTGPQ